MGTLESSMEETAFSVLNNRGGSARPIEPKNFIETMKVYNMAQDSSLKDFRISTNWETRITRVSEIPSLFEQEYILVLEDSDFK